MSNEYYKEFDKVYLSMRDILSNYTKSTILQNYFLNGFESLFYGTLINNFFINLNQKNIKKSNLPKGQIGKIKNEYKNIQRDVKLALAFSLKNKKIDEKYYDNFKSKIENDFPEFQKIISEIEKEIKVEKAKEYLKKKEEEIQNLGKPDTDFNTFFITKILEVYIKKEKCLPIGKKFDKLINVVAKENLPKLSHEFFKSLNKNSKKMLGDQRKYQRKFEKRLCERWKTPFNLLECLIRISLESGEEHTNKLSKTIDNTNNFKREALIKIHARALQISNEILVLLKSGYADGANARWRSLHELAVISFFLLDNNNDVAKRYLEHEIVKTFKEAKDYRAYYKKLGFPPIEIKEFNKIKREKEKLCKKYNDRFQDDYGWIPSSLLKDRNFKALEKLVKLDKLRPFYNFQVILFMVVQRAFIVWA
jgi:ribosomal protein S17E